MDIYDESVLRKRRPQVAKERLTMVSAYPVTEVSA